MDIVQSFYDNMATEYDKLFLDWEASVMEQALILDKLFKDNGYTLESKILDCACGIGTQAIGLANMGYKVTASDISKNELKEAKKRACEYNVNIDFHNEDFRKLSGSFSNKFDIIIAMDNALTHMLTEEELKKAIESITNRLSSGGMFVASIRDYDSILLNRPPYSPPYIHKTDDGQRVSFQTWDWKGDNYKLIQYIIEDGQSVVVNKFECEYRAVRRQGLTDILTQFGCSSVKWLFPDETDFYQPVLIAKK